MRNFYKIMAVATVAVTTAVFTGCSSDDDFMVEPIGSGTPRPVLSRIRTAH